MACTTAKTAYILLQRITERDVLYRRLAVRSVAWRVVLARRVTSS